MNLFLQTFDFMPWFMQNSCVFLKKKYKIFWWNRRDQAIPIPHAIKQETIVKYKKKYSIDTFVESGTYLGNTIWAQRNNFNKIYSIELCKEFVQLATKRFKQKSHIEIIEGDSGEVMNDVVKKLPNRALFWLDGHYSSGNPIRGRKDTPIIEEIKAIFSSGIEHILLIDDAHRFIGERDYPSIEGLSKYILMVYPESNIHIENNCIVVELKNAKKIEEETLSN